MLDLEPGVHLQEHELLGRRLEEALDRAGVLIAHRHAGPHRRVEQPRPQLVADRRRGGLLGDLLVPPLHRAVTLPERDARAVGEPEDLHLDVPGALDVALQEDGRRAVQPLRPALRARENGAQARVVVDRPHPDAATAGARLDHQRVAERRQRRQRGSTS